MARRAMYSVLGTLGTNIGVREGGSGGAVDPPIRADI